MNPDHHRVQDNSRHQHERSRVIVASVEYIRTEKITTTITGEGTHAEDSTLPARFEYTYGDKYEMDWTDPSTTTTAEAD